MESHPKQLQISTPAAIIIAGVIVALAVVWGTNRNGTQTTPTTGTATQPQTAPSAVAVDSSKVNTVGEPYIGNPNAPLTIAYWFDYQCPFCKQDEETTIPQIIQNYVDTGKVKIVFKDYAFLGADSQTLGEYARAVWATAPTEFYQWHKAIYDNQGTENTGWATPAKILSITTSVLGASDASKVAALVQTNAATYDQEMNADKAEGTADGITGTPAMIIGKQLISGAVPYSQIQAAITAALPN